MCHPPAMETMETREEQPRPERLAATPTLQRKEAREERRPPPHDRRTLLGRALAQQLLCRAAPHVPGVAVPLFEVSDRKRGDAACRRHWKRQGATLLVSVHLTPHELDARLHNSQTLQTDVFDALAVIKRMSPKRRISSETSVQFIFQLTKHIPNCSQPQQSGQTTIPFQAGHTDDTQTGAISSWQQLNLESPASIRTGFGGFFVGKKDGRLRRILDAWLVELIARCSSKVSICTPKSPGARRFART